MKQYFGVRLERGTLLGIKILATLRGVTASKLIETVIQKHLQDCGIDDGLLGHLVKNHTQSH